MSSSLNRAGQRGYPLCGSGFDGTGETIVITDAFGSATSLAAPTFSAVMAIAAQKAEQSLGQAARLVYDLPAGAATDIVSFGSAGNVTGSTTTSRGTTVLSGDQLAAPLQNTTTSYSALYNSPFSTRWFVITFGTDSWLTTSLGWDNVTSVGTPDGAAFVSAIAR